MTHELQIMALLDLGIYTDEGNDRGQSTTLFVPDEGELPELLETDLHSITLRTTFGTGYGLGQHRLVQLFIEELQFDSRSINIFFVESRREWVCFLCRSFFSPFGYYLGDHTFAGPYRVNRITMEEVLHVYEVDHRLAPTPEIIRCHPDFLHELRMEEIRL